MNKTALRKSTEKKTFAEPKKKTPQNSSRKKVFERKTPPSVKARKSPVSKAYHSTSTKKVNVNQNSMRKVTNGQNPSIKSKPSLLKSPKIVSKLNNSALKHSVSSIDKKVSTNSINTKENVLPKSQGKLLTFNWIQFM